MQWYDLFPVFSYLCLGGKCRHCKKPISPIYPIVELTTAVVFTVYLLVNGSQLVLSVFYYLAILALFIVLIFFDFLYLILPDKIVLAIASLSILYSLFFRKDELFNLLVAGFSLGAIFIIIYIVSNGEWMGFGDVKLATVIGFLLGYPLGFWMMLASVWVAAITGVTLMLLGKANMKSPLPFGSFMSAVFIIFTIFNGPIQKQIQIISRFF